MNLSFLTPDEQRSLAEGDYDAIPTDKLLKLHDDAIEEQRRDMPSSVTEKVKETGSSPLSLMQRIAVQFGDKPGNIDYLKKQGLDPIYRNDKLNIRNQDQSLTPADPSNFNLMSLLKDAPADVLEFAADVPATGLQGLGELGGAAIGTAVGGPFGGWLGRTAGGAAGSYGGEKIRQGIGSQIGNYSGEFSGEDSTGAAWSGGLGAQITPLLGLLKGGAKEIGTTGLDRKIGERMFSTGTGLEQELVDNPEVIDFLMKQGVSGNEKQVLNFANQNAGLAEKELQNALSTGDQVPLDSVLERMKKFQGRNAAGDVGLKNKATKNVINEFKNDIDLFDKKKMASQVDLNQAKRDLYKSSQKLFNTETYQVTKKQAQKELSLGIKDLLENMNSSNLGEINKKLHAYSVLADMMDLKISDDLAKPVLSGTTRVVGSLGGAQSGAINALVKKLTTSTKFNTKAGVGIKKLLESMAKISSEPTKKSLGSDLLLGEILRSQNQ